MELRRYLSIARHRLPLIVAIVLAALAGAYLITPHQASYSASTTIYLGPQQLSLQSTGEASQTGAGIAGYDRFINTFVKGIESRDVAENAQAQARVNRSAEKVQKETSAQQIPNTNLLQITVVDKDPAVAKTLADAVADAFIKKANGVSAGGNAQAYLTVWQPALLPTVPLGNGLVTNLVIGLVLGLVVAGLVVALIEYLDITIRTPDDAERRLGLPVLGVIPALGERLPATPALRVSGARGANGSGSREPRSSAGDGQGVATRA